MTNITKHFRKDVITWKLENGECFSDSIHDEL